MNIDEDRRASVACLHCRCAIATRHRPRGLCFRCYRDHAIRCRYGRGQYTGPGADNALSRPPAVPTVHPPGSAAKLAVLAERVGRGEDLFHPKDAGHD